MPLTGLSYGLEEQLVEFFGKALVQQSLLLILMGLEDETLVEESPHLVYLRKHQQILLEEGEAVGLGLLDVYRESLSVEEEQKEIDAELDFQSVEVLLGLQSIRNDLEIHRLIHPVLQIHEPNQIFKTTRETQGVFIDGAENVLEILLH